MMQKGRCKSFMRRALYPGSFDPIHFGHMQIIDRACKLFDEVYVAVLVNPSKYSSGERLLEIKERVRIIRNLYKDNTKVHVVYSYRINTVLIAQKYNCDVIIRGIRDGSDFETENSFNEIIHIEGNSKIDVLYLISLSNYSSYNCHPEPWAISSSLIRKKYRNGEKIYGLCPQEVIDFLNKKYKRL